MEGKINALPKYVASHARVKLAWQPAKFIRDVVNEVAEIKSRYPREVQVHGSCGLAQTLIRHGLIDEYRLLTFPVVLGSGKRLFGEGAVPTSYRLMNCTTTASGMIVATYRRGGTLRTGSFALE